MNVLFKNCRTAHEQMEYHYILALRGKEIKIYKYIFKLFGLARWILRNTILYQ